MKLKKGVKLKGLQPEILFGMIAVNDLLGGITVTSVMDGMHSPKSLHYKGQAFDMRIWSMAHPDKTAESIQKLLGDEFDVVLELDKAHIHIEFDPKNT